MICLPPVQLTVQTQNSICRKGEKSLIKGWQFIVQNLDQLYVLDSSAHKTTHHDITYTSVIKVMLKPNKLELNTISGIMFKAMTLFMWVIIRDTFMQSFNPKFFPINQSDSLT